MEARRISHVKKDVSNLIKQESTKMEQAQVFAANLLRQKSGRRWPWTTKLVVGDRHWLYGQERSIHCKSSLTSKESILTRP
jgi:hypothetical protein